jgi:hypothetical protein
MVRMTHTLLIEIKQVIEMNCTFAWVHEFKGSAFGNLRELPQRQSRFFKGYSFSVSGQVVL